MRLTQLLPLALLAVAAGARADLPEPDVEVARRHHDRGADLYRETRYREALAEFEVARSLHPSPEIDYNVARCLDRLERWSDAADAYEKYAGSHPRDEAEVLARASTLRARVASISGGEGSPQAHMRDPSPYNVLDPALRPSLDPPARALPAIAVVPPDALAASLRAAPSPAPAPRKSRWRWWAAGGAGALATTLGVSLGLGLGLREGPATPIPATTDGHHTARFP